MGEFSPLKNELIRLRKAGVQFTLLSGEFFYVKYNFGAKKKLYPKKKMCV